MSTGPVPTLTPERRAQVVEYLANPGGVSIAQFARNLGLPPSTVGGWVRAVRGRKNPLPAPNRNCLRCAAPFFSEGNHNRMCDNCRGATASPFAPNGYSGRGRMSDLLMSGF